MNILKPLLLILTVLLFIITDITSQSSVNLDGISNEHIFDHNQITSKQALTVYKTRYNTAELNNNTKDQYQLGKYIAQTLYKVMQPRDIPQWHSKVDSLANILIEIAYDKKYELHKISYAYLTDNQGEAEQLAMDMKSKVIVSKDTAWMIDWYCKMILIKDKKHDRAEALKHLLTAENINIKSPTDNQTALLLYVRGAIDYSEGKYDLALENAMKSESIFEEIKNFDMLLPLYRNIINVALDSKNIKIALSYREKLSALQKTTGSQIGYYKGEVSRIFDLILLEMYHEAIQLAEKTIAYADSTKREPAHAIYLMGVAHRGLDQYPKAAILINKAFDRVKDKRANGQSSFYAHALSQTYEWDDKYKAALDWYQVHISYRDSVVNEKKLKEIAVYEAQIEALDQRRKVEILEANAKIERQKKNTLWLTIILGSLLALSLLYSQRQRSKKQKLKQESLLLKSNLETEKLQHLLEYKQKELASQILNMTHKNTLLQDVRDGISELKNAENSHAISRLLRPINRSINNNEEWDQFLTTFKSIHSSFLNKLKNMSAALTSNEIRLASLMKMNLSSKEIASMLNISSDGVKKARYRLRKKLGLESKINIQDFLLWM